MSCVFPAARENQPWDQPERLQCEVWHLEFRNHNGTMTSRCLCWIIWLHSFYIWSNFYLKYVSFWEFFLLFLFRLLYVIFIFVFSSLLFNPPFRLSWPSSVFPTTPGEHRSSSWSRWWRNLHLSFLLISSLQSSWTSPLSGTWLCDVTAKLFSHTAGLTTFVFIVLFFFCLFLFQFEEIFQGAADVRRANGERL